MIIRRFLIIVMSAFVVCNPALARSSVLGVVVTANRVHLNTSTVTPGATVYDGDQFSTEAGGALRVRSSTAMLELGEESTVNMRNSANGAHGLEVELDKGTLVFSTARAASLNVIALKAIIRAATDTRTFTRITVTGPKKLRICASRGALQFSYRGETQTMAEGRTYLVILDQPDDTPNGKEPPPPARPPKAFTIVIISEAAAIVGLGIYELREPESPDRP